MKQYRHVYLNLIIAGLLCLFPASVFAGICSVVDAGTYIEAEDFTNPNAADFSNNFDYKTDGKGASGGEYLQAIGGGRRSSVQPTAVEYEVTFKTAGTFYLFVHGNGRGSNSKDSIWYGVNGTPEGNITFNGTSGWRWEATKQDSGTDPASINIPAPGTYKITFWKRERGFRFDSFLLTTTSGISSINSSLTPPSWATKINPTDPNNDSCGTVAVDPDVDGDGFPLSNDCNDTVATIHPGAPECTALGLGDNIDNNCNLTIDEGCFDDYDSDGYTTDPSSSVTDCIDTNAQINPGMREICNDLVDNDCDGLVDLADNDCDVDGDGYTVDAGDCRDDRPDINPGAQEICGDLVDNDCTNGVDDGCDTASVVDGGLIAQIPLILKNPAKPQVMIDMSNDQQLYFSAYSDYDDQNQDDIPDGTYIHAVDYFGYFDSRKCYTYDTTHDRFNPASITSDKYCNASAGSSEWSGNFLNWASTARIDAVRKILYGGHRVVDSATETVLERSYLPNDAHSWVKTYSGNDINKLTPFTVNNLPTTAISTSNITIGKGNKTFTTDFLSTEVYVGDQLAIVMPADPYNNQMRGQVTGVTGSDVDVAVTWSVGDGNSYSNWALSNQSRKGISICNTTYASTGYSQSITDAPLIRIAYGDYNLWTSNERWQCKWNEEIARDNKNNIGVTGISSNRYTPVKSNVSLGNGINPGDFAARVKVCDSSLLGNEKCREYPGSGSGSVFKPVGVLQVHGENDSLYFGLMTGSYTKNRSGGVLRKNVSSITDEINVATDGTLKSAPSAGSIIKTLDTLRIYGYNHAPGTGNSNGTYNDSGSGDNCSWGLSTFTEGNCSNWGNPQSEIFLESLRYFAGKSADSSFNVSGDDKLTGLVEATWSDPLSADNYCTPLNIININASMASYDDNQLSGVSDLNTTDSAATLTDIVGAGEGIHGKSWIVGESTSDTNQLCTSKSVTSLGDVKGICPEAPRLSGSYNIAGLAHYAFTNDIRSDLQDDQTVKTYGVALAPAVPKIDIAVPGSTDKKVTILPACRNTSLNPGGDKVGNCAIVNFKPVKFNKADGSGLFFIQWEDSEQGGDYDQDMSGFLGFNIDSSVTPPTIDITTDVIADSTPNALAFGYIIGGTDGDGFHAASGIKGSNVDACSNCQTADEAVTSTYEITGTPSGQLEQPLFYAAKWGGYDKDNPNLTFPTDTASWDADGDGLPDSYFYSTNPSQLESSLGKVFASLAEINSSSAAVASNSTQLKTGTTIYQAKFNSADWSGQFLGVSLTRNSSGNIVTTQIWDAESQFPTPANRKVWTLNPSATAAPYGVEFKWSLLAAVQKLALDTSIAGTIDSLGSSRVDFLRGDRTTERNNGGALRDRSKVLGDIVNSDPVFVGTPDYGYAKLAGTEGTSYTSFRASTAYGNRKKIVYVGANDGMLHAFDAAAGTEIFAYVPNSVIPLLPRLTATNYGTQQNGHRFLVDGAPKPADAYLGGAWKSILLGSTGAGGKTVFALDITDPENFDGNDVLWEIHNATTDASSNLVYQDLGFTLPQPTVGRLKSGEWVAFISNGYHSTNGKAVLYVVDLATGLPLSTTNGDSFDGTIDVGVGNTTNPNGLSAPVPVDEDGDKIVDYVYAGDLQGNLWKFDFTDATPSNWGVAYTSGTTPIPLFTARGPSGEVQPITVRPSVGRHPQQGIMLWFGTGKFFDSNDNVVDPVVINRDVYSFYGIQDKGSAITVTDRSVLQSQSILFEGQVAIPGSNPVQYYFDGDEIRVMSETAVNYGTGTGTKNGWYIDLVSPNTPTKRGERVVEKAVFDAGKIIFVTLIPSESPCVPGGESWLMEMDPFSGGSIADPIYDANGDGKIDSNDFVTVTIGGADVQVPVSGLKSGEGIIQAPKILDDDSVVNPDNTSTQVKVFSGSTGNLEFKEEKGDTLSGKGRQSWRQIK